MLCMLTRYTGAEQLNTDTHAPQEKQTKVVAISQWRHLWEPGETP